MEHEFQAGTRAFTLIELSIVLVIIGLIVGGVLVGQDLIRAATVRSQIAQIEKIRTAVNTFKGKYGELPGDIGSKLAAQYGFVARAGTLGRGDENGVVEGFNYQDGYNYGWNGSGETLFFWADLSTAKLIQGGFTTVIDANQQPNASNPDLYIPKAIIPEAYLFVFSVCQWGGSCYTAGIPGSTYMALSSVVTNMGGVSFPGVGTGGITVAQAYAIDKKIDDGLPQSGNATAFYPNYDYSWTPRLARNAPTASPTTCFDTTTAAYSITQNNGSGVNCGLSFKLQ